MPARAGPSTRGTTKTSPHRKTFDGSFWRRNGSGLDARAADPTGTTGTRFQVFVSGGGEVGMGKQIFLRADNRRHVVAENGGGGAVNANRVSAGIWETFTVEQPRRAHVVRLRRESTTRYVHVANDGAMRVDRRLSYEDENQAFWILDHNGGDLESGDSISFETLRSGRFASTCQSGTGQVRGDANYVSACSRFTIEKLGGARGAKIRNLDNIAFRSSDGNYLTAVADYPGHTGKLMNYSPWVGAWQRFTVEHVQGNRWESR